MNADVKHLPYKDSSFDLIISTSTLDHQSKKEMIEALKEVKRVLEEKGTLFLVLNNRHNLNFRFMLTFGEFIKVLTYPSKFYGLDEIKAILKRLRFNTVKSESIVHIPSPLNTLAQLCSSLFGKEIANRLVREILRLYKNLFWSRFRLRTGCFLAYQCFKKD